MGGLAFCNVDGMTGKTRSFPDEAAFFGEESWDFPAYELVADGFVTVGVDFVGICHFPGAAGRAVVIRHSLGRGGEFGLVGIKGIAIFIFGTANFAWASAGIDLKDGVLRPVDIGVYTHTKEMLVVVGVDAGVDFCTPSKSVFAWVH